MKWHTETNLRRFIRTFLVIPLFLHFTHSVQSQSPQPQTSPQSSQTSPQSSQASLQSMPALQEPPAADLAKTGILGDISAGTLLYFSPNRHLTKEQLPYLPFTIRGTKKYDHFIPAHLVDTKAVLKFTLANSSDQEQSVYFCPGFYFDSIGLYKLNTRIAAPQPGNSTDTAAARIDSLPASMPDDADSLGYRRISLAPHENGTFFVVLSFVKTPINSINPSLTRDTLVRSGIILNHKNKTSIDIITNLFAGIMLMMIFYSISEYLQTGRLHFLYYIGYAACISTLLFLKSVLHNATTSFNFFFESYFDNVIFCLGNLSYILFHRKFLDTEKAYPPLDRTFFWGAISIATLTLLYSLFFFFSPSFVVANAIEDSTKILLMVILVIFIVRGLQYRNRLMNYIVCGNLSLCLLAIISQIMISTNFKIVKGVSVLNLALFHYEVGITIELLFFLFALTYKNKRELIISVQKEEKLKLETQRKELEKQVAVLAATQDERNRISADMHDELGSGVTAIRLMSEIVKSKMKEQTLPEIEKISHSANELLNKMNTIIWTMTSSNDSVENLVAYIRSYAVEFFESTSIDCYFSMPASIPHREITGEKRRNLFLSVKESLNNVLKHSQSTVVKINVTINDKLIIEIQDDGVGINMEKLRKFGNGLNNMKKRMASINGEFDIQNIDGTRTTFGLVL